MITPENILFRRVGQRLLEDINQAQDHGVEIFVHELGALGAFRRLRAESAVILPPLAALDIQVEVGVEEGMKSAFNGGVAPGRSEEHTSALQSLMRISYAVFCLTKQHNASLLIIVI